VRHICINSLLSNLSLTGLCYSLTRINISYLDFIRFVHWINELILIDSIAMGINEWFAPQISEH